VIIFDTLTGGKMIMDESSANARHFVGANRRADSTAANGQATINLAGNDGFCERHHEIGIVVLRVQSVGAEVHHLVPGCVKSGHEIFFEAEATMIGSNSNPHAISLSSSP
jgi:hypothetical protein